MKKIIIGGTLFLSGILAITGILISGALNLMTLHGWSGNKLTYSIFSMEQLNLGIWFTLAVLLCVIGLVVWAIELNNIKIKKAELAIPYSCLK